MTDNDMACWDAAYVLGALSREDRKIYEVWLAENPEQATALTELARMRAVLAMLSRREALTLI